jgi:hypothetical protein
MRLPDHMMVVTNVNDEFLSGLCKVIYNLTLPSPGLQYVGLFLTRILYGSGAQLTQATWEQA